MKHQKLLILILVFVTVLSSLQVNSASADEEQSESMSVTNINKPTFGVELNRTYFSGLYEDSLIKANAANNHWLRLNALLWSDVQPTSKNDWAWENVAQLDEHIKAASAAGMEVILIIRSTPLWAQKFTIANGYDADYFCGPMKAGNFSDFADFMVEVVERYSQPPFNVTYFELWNEPDEYRGYKPPVGVITPTGVFGCWGEKSDSQYFGGQHYGKMLNVVYPAVKNAVPSAQIVLGGLLLPCDPNRSWDYCDMSNFFKGIVSEAGGNFDYANFHGYTIYDTAFSSGILMERGSHWWADRGGMVEGKFKYLQDVMESYGVFDKPILCTEVALADFGDLAVDTDENPNAAETFEAVKADYLVYVFVRNIALGIEGSTWYHMERHGWNKSGLLDRDNQPLPAYEAFKVLTTTLGGVDYHHQLSHLGSGVLGYEFRKGDSRIWVLFSEDGDEKTINKSSIPFEIEHVYDLFRDDVNQTGTTISFDRPIYIDNIPSTIPDISSDPEEVVDQHELYHYQIQTTSTPPGFSHLNTINPISIPNWMTLIDNRDGTATLSGTPNDEQLAEKSHHVEIRVTNTHGNLSTQSFTIWVNNVNDPPQFISTPVRTAEPGELYVYEIEATDQDYIHGEESLTIEAVSMPDWLGLEVFDYDGSGIWEAKLTGIPTQAQIDERPIVHLSVTDKEGDSAVQIYTIGLDYIYLPLILR